MRTQRIHYAAGGVSSPVFLNSPAETIGAATYRFHLNNDSYSLLR